MKKGQKLPEEDKVKRHCKGFISCNNVIIKESCLQTMLMQVRTDAAVIYALYFHSQPPESFTSHKDWK